MVGFCFASAMRAMRPPSTTISLLRRTWPLPSISVVVRMTIGWAAAVAPAASTPARLYAFSAFLQNSRHLPISVAGSIALIFVLDIAGKRVLLLLHELQDRRDRRVALAPRGVPAVVPLHVLQVKIGDALMVLAGMKATASKLAAVKWPMSRLTPLYLEYDIAVAKLSGVANSLGSEGVVVAVVADHHLVLVGERRDAFGDAHLRARRNRAYAEGFGHLKGVVDIVVGDLPGSC